ncbi:MAG: 50S ribosomal protein L21 [Candidatus Buchananbacteria bacterium RBG_13_36_9]|uniref:Large ribosomal subunit protein bL21 n=1 Tax=Candidatus Buchananbacteria bacterium RBG_13_36_9 TaxID=1797530 RepID=A0A1G1XQK7_9BACT|nr:MAG: 50S ribosomal protein L21 [Candidatus Buchananbacteria bacterium RBG_13_36_9]
MAKLAIIKTGGKQYKVKEGDKIDIEKLEGKEGKKVEFKEVLLVADENGKEVEIGTPVVKGKKVSGAIVNQFRDDKITVIKYKAKSRYRRKKGHRQHKTLVKIESIA